MLNILLAPRMKSTWITLAFFCLILLVVYFFEWRQGAELDAIIANLSTTVPLLFVSILVGFLFLSLIGSVVRDEKSGLGWHRYEILVEGLRETTEINEELKKWRGIERIWRTDGYIFVQLNFYLYHIIPARAFNDPAEFQQFGEILTERVNRG